MKEKKNLFIAQPTLRKWKYETNPDQTDFTCSSLKNQHWFITVVLWLTECDAVVDYNRLVFDAYV